MSDEGSPKLTDTVKDTVKKILTVSIGTLFLTEESIRNLVSEFKLPKEWIAGLIDSAGRTRKEFFEKLSEDVISKLKDQVNMKEMVTEFLENHDTEMTIKLKFNKNKKGQDE